MTKDNDLLEWMVEIDKVTNNIVEEGSAEAAHAEEDSPELERARKMGLILSTQPYDPAMGEAICYVNGKKKHSKFVKVVVYLPGALKAELESAIVGPYTGGYLGLIEYGLQILEKEKIQLDVAMALPLDPESQDRAERLGLSVSTRPRVIDTLRINSQGRNPRAGAAGVMLPMPFDMHAEIQSISTGSLTGSVLGLIEFALQRLRAEGVALLVDPDPFRHEEEIGEVASTRRPGRPRTRQ